MQNNFNLDAIYPAGYAPEMGFKALLLHCTPSGRRSDIAFLFHGAAGHNLE